MMPIDADLGFLLGFFSAIGFMFMIMLGMELAEHDIKKWRDKK